jgi:hypothetical protein
MVESRGGALDWSVGSPAWLSGGHLTRLSVIGVQNASRYLSTLVNGVHIHSGGWRVSERVWPVVVKGFDLFISPLQRIVELELDSAGPLLGVLDCIHDDDPSGHPVSNRSTSNRVTTGSISARISTGSSRTGRTNRQRC